MSYTESESMDQTMERSVSTESAETPPYVNACFDEMESKEMTCVDFDSSTVSQLAENELSPIKSEPFLREQQNLQDAWLDILALVNRQNSTTNGAYFDEMESQEMTCVDFDSSTVSQLAENELSPIKSEPFLHEQQNQQDAYAELNGNIVALMNEKTSTAFGAYLERVCGPRRIESVTETNEQDESNTNDDENGNFDAPDDELWNDKLALECINQNSQSNSDDDDYRYKSFNAVRDQNNKKIFKLETIEGHIITYSSWTRLKEKLCEYHYPIDQVILQDVELNSKAMDFFRSVDPILFTKDMCFNLIDFSKARAPSAERAFIELFRNHFNPKWIQFEGLKGISSEFFASATIEHSLLNSANTIKFLDTTKDADPFVLDNDFILRFLHSDKHTSPRKRLIIHHKFLGRNTLKGIWNMILQKFANDSIPSNPFVFSIQCERVFEPLFKRCEYNAKTKEELIISDISFRKNTSVETAMRYDHTPNGFKVSIVRRAHCRRLRDRKYLRSGV